MRIFNIIEMGKNLVVYNDEDIVKGYYEGGSLVLLEESSLNKYKEYVKEQEEKNNEDYESLRDWLYQNDLEYTDYSDTYVKEEDFEGLSEEWVLVYEEELEPFDYTDINWWGLIWEHWDGSNWRTIEVENEVNTEVTEDYPGLRKINTFYGEYNEYHEWADYRTGQSDIYIDDNGNYYVVYSSYYQGSLDYIESATEDELIETFGEDFNK